MNKVQEWASHVDFGDVTSSQAVERQWPAVRLATLVERIAIASPYGVDRWIVEMETPDNRLLLMGCTDVWPRIHPHAAFLSLVHPIRLLLGQKGVVVRLRSREASARVATMQLCGTEFVHNAPFY